VTASKIVGIVHNKLDSISEKFTQNSKRKETENFHSAVRFSQCCEKKTFSFLFCNNLNIWCYCYLSENEFESDFLDHLAMRNVEKDEL